uniref:EF-hand calcium binding domain 14 n=1 Tax=Sphenodon punctatus TaxID=8508 RepID=A0A8D0GZC3_SPHPU
GSSRHVGQRGRRDEGGWGIRGGGGGAEGSNRGLEGDQGREVGGNYVRCCKFCYPLCAFVILAACVVACVGLVWMQVALKEDLDTLKEKFRTMESNQKTSFQEIPKLNEDLLSKQKQLEKIEAGETGLSKIWVNITEINKQISLLTLAVNHLKANIKSASDLITLPDTVEELQKSVATIGNGLTGIHHDVASMQTKIEEHKKTIEALQNNMTENCKQDNQYLHTMLEEVNTTLVSYQKMNDLKLLSVDAAASNLTRRVTLLENYLVAVKLEKRENLSSSVVGALTTSPKVDNLDHPENETDTDKTQKIEDSQVSKLREKLQLINALSSKTENDRSESELKVENRRRGPTNLPRLSSRAVVGNVEGSRRPRHLSLPGISSMEDLQELFDKADQGVDGKLSYEDLQSLLSSTIQEPQSFKEFDADRDEKYSLPELRLALGV